MTDPRTILASIGVSLPEVEEYTEATSGYNRDADRRILSAQASSAFFVMDAADAALVALAQELAKWKWVAEHEVDEVHDCDGIHSETVVEEVPDSEVAYLLARYEEAQHE